MNESVVAIQMGLQTQIFVFSPNLIRKILKSADARAGVYFPKVMQNFVGDNGAFRRLSPQLRDSISATTLTTLLTDEAHLAKLASTSARILEREMADFVSFNRSLVDQMVWERNTGIEIDEQSGPAATTSGGANVQSCQVGLYALIRNHTTYHLTRLLMGQALLDFHPEIIDDLSSWDQEYVRLIAGAPRWLPMPGISAAYAARDRVQKTISVFQASFSALEDGRIAPLEFRDLDDVSEVFQERMRFWRRSDISSSLSARLDAWLLWRITTDTSKLVFWNVLRIFSDPSLLAKIREEIASYVRVIVSDPKVTGLPIAEPPRLSINAQKVFDDCPWLKATYAETIRLHSNPISYRKLTANLTLTGSDGDDRMCLDTDKRTYQFVKNDVLALASGTYHMDPNYFIDPKRFVPQRYLSDPSSPLALSPSSLSASSLDSSSEDYKTNKKPKRQNKLSFNWNEIVPFAGDEVFGALVEKQVLLITASIVSLWDIESASSDRKELKIPGHRLSANVFMPASNTKVRLRRHV